MDYFETARKYRLRSFKKLRSWVINVIILILVAIIFWQIGLRDRNNNLAKQRKEINSLEKNFNLAKQQLESLKIEAVKDKKNLEKLKFELSAKPQTEIGDILKLSVDVLSEGVSIDHLKSNIKKLRMPTKCKSSKPKDIDVITPIYLSLRKEVKFLENGLSVSAEGRADSSLNTVHPWFDVSKPVRVRVMYFGFEDWFAGELPFSIKIPIQDRIIVIDLSESSIRGSMTALVSVCS